MRLIGERNSRSSNKRRKKRANSYKKSIMFFKNINFIFSHSFQMKCLIIFMYVFICFVENSKSAETGRLSFQVNLTYWLVTWRDELIPEYFSGRPGNGSFPLNQTN
jgi:hypothetical protein